MVAVADICGQPQCILLHPSLDRPIAQKSKPVPVAILDIIVLKPWILDSFQEVDCRSWPEIDAVLDLAILEPRATLFLEHCILVEFVKVLVDVVEGLLPDRHGLDCLGLHLLHAFDAVFNCRLDRGQQSPAGPCRPGSDDGVIIGESMIYQYL